MASAVSGDRRLLPSIIVAGAFGLLWLALIHFGPRPESLDTPATAPAEQPNSLTSGPSGEALVRRASDGDVAAVDTDARFAQQGTLATVVDDAGRVLSAVMARLDATDTLAPAMHAHRAGQWFRLTGEPDAPARLTRAR